MNEKASAAEAGPGDLKTVAEIVTSAKIGVLTTITASGALHSRPLAAQDVEFDGDLWFFTQDPSSKVDDIAANDQVNAAFESKDGYLSQRARTTRRLRSSRCTPSRRKSGRLTNRVW